MKVLTYFCIFCRGEQAAFVNFSSLESAQAAFVAFGGQVNVLGMSFPLCKPLSRKPNPRARSRSPSAADRKQSHSNQPAVSQRVSVSPVRVQPASIKLNNLAAGTTEDDVKTACATNDAWSGKISFHISFHGSHAYITFPSLDLAQKAYKLQKLRGGSLLICGKKINLGDPKEKAAADSDQSAAAP